MIDQLESDIQRGQRAAQLLAEPMIQEAFAVLKQEVNDQWSKSPARDAEGREMLYLMWKAADRVEAHLRSIMESGKIAEKTLEMKLAPVIGRRSSGF